MNDPGAKVASNAGNAIIGDANAAAVGDNNVAVIGEAACAAEKIAERSRVELDEAARQSAEDARRRRLALRKLNSTGIKGRSSKKCRTEGSASSSADSGGGVDSSLSSLSSSSTGVVITAGIVGTYGGSGNSRNIPCPSHGFVSLTGRRRNMEDTVTVAPWLGAGTRHRFYAVYDGHGGSRVAETCRLRMHAVLAEEVAARGGWATMIAAGANGWWCDALKASFARVDSEVLSGMTQAEKMVGSTAIVAIVGPRHVVVANCGDSRAVLSRAGGCVALSCDHKPNRPDELARIEGMGGRVIEWDGWRVFGVLACSRSLGDFYLKPWVSGEPEITVTERTSKDEFLILASDGLWDALSNDEACKLVRRCLSGRAMQMNPEQVRGRSAADAAVLLSEVAIDKGSRDNISAIVIDLRRLRNL